MGQPGEREKNLWPRWGSNPRPTEKTTVALSTEILYFLHLVFPSASSLLYLWIASKEDDILTRVAGCAETDSHKWCPYWSTLGFCSSSKGKEDYDYMMANCTKSCTCTCKISVLNDRGWAVPTEKQNLSRRKCLKGFFEFVFGRNLVCAAYSCKSLLKTKINKNLGPHLRKSKTFPDENAWKVSLNLSLVKT